MSDVDDLLQKTSRTFAVTIPLLPAPTRHEVGVAYLLFRIIDTFEDAVGWRPEQRAEAIRTFVPLLDGSDEGAEQRFAQAHLTPPPVDHDGYIQLLGDIPYVLRQLRDIREPSRSLIREHVKRSAAGMVAIVSRAELDEKVKLDTLDELRDYCYVVAGIVGEMLTELFLVGRPQLAGIAPYLRERSRMFGEGLQLVNILKDAQADEREGRVFLPAAVDRAEVMDLARNDLRSASEYTLALQGQGAERGLIAFNALLVRLAQGTLGAIRMQRPGGKLSRAEVLALVTAVLRDVEDDSPVLPLDGSESQVPVAV